MFRARIVDSRDVYREIDREREREGEALVYKVAGVLGARKRDAKSFGAACGEKEGDKRQGRK